MKKTKKIKKKSWRILLPAVLLVLIAVAAAFAWKEKTDAVAATEPVSFETDYGELLYPQEWGDRVQVETEAGDDYSVSSFFFVMSDGTNVPLFDVSFGRQDGAYLGEIQTKDGTLVPVFIRSYSLREEEKWVQDDINTYYAMQEDVNFLIGKLPLINTQSPDGQGANQVEIPDMEIETPYGKLYFPGRWKAELRVDNQENMVSFYAAMSGLTECRLFDVCFNTAEQGALGYLETEAGEKIPVGIQFYTIQRADDWNDYVMDRILVMQEDVNHLIDKLDLKPLDSQPQVQQAVESASGEDLMIQTPYGALQYPGKWVQYLSTESSETGEYTVSFFAELPGKERMPLFEVVFGSSGQLAVGSLQTENGETLEVTINPHKLDFAGTWTSAEQDVVFEMMESMNYVLSQLPLSGT